MSARSNPSAARLRPSTSSKHLRVTSVDLEASPSKGKAKQAGKRQEDSSLWSVIVAAALGVLLVQLLSRFVPSRAPETLIASPSLHAGNVTRLRRDVQVRSATRTHVVKPDERFLAYFPHSGYHNQRISLENALTLAYMLNRTLLVPPARLGNAIPYISFDKLYLRTNQATKVGLDHCKHAGQIMPHECIGYFDWTAVAWDFLVDFEAAAKVVSVVDRWNGTYEWLEDELGIMEDDIYSIADDRMYQYRIYDTPSDDTPLQKFEKRLDLAKLRKLNNHKLIHLGTLFGTSRLRTVQDENGDARSLFRRSMVFRNPLVDRITDAICARMGGPAGYFGLHLRVGDGLFLKHARQNARDVLFRLLEGKMHLEKEVIDEVLAVSDAKRHVGPVDHLQKRALADEPVASNVTLAKRSNSRPQKDNAYHHAPLEPLPVIRDADSSPLDRTLRCRGSYWTDARLLKLNAPVFLATDSRQPMSDPNLAVLFDVLPCLFVLGDFSAHQPTSINAEPIAELSELDTLFNEEDGVALAQFLFPIIDMVSAAKARAIVGTHSSTFSRFAIDVLHQVYHGWDIVERG